MTFTNWLNQILVVTKFSLLSIPERKGAAMATAFGIAGVVAVLVGVLSIAYGFRAAMTAAGQPDCAVVMRTGSDNEMTSNLTIEEGKVVSDSTHLARNENGAVASAELYVILNLPKRSTGTDANVPLRGIHQQAYAARKDLKIIAGRKFEPGRNEVIVGRAAANEFSHCELGGKIPVGGQQMWTVVGIFSSNGGVAESEIWADAPLVQQTYHRGSTFQSIYCKLKSASEYQAFDDELTSDPRMKVVVKSESEYYADQSRVMSDIITKLGFSIAILMAIGAVFGALNTMYSAVAARTREIATLRALGFGTAPVIISVLIESLVLAVVGGIIGGGAAYLLFDGYQAATMNFQSFTQVAFAFAVTPQLLIQGAVFAAIIGFFGGLFPAIRAARMQIAPALREM
jgi:putative ABC transport system permease protein